MNDEPPVIEDEENPYLPSSDFAAVEDPSAPTGNFAILLTILFVVGASIYAAFVGWWGLAVPASVTIVLGAIRAKFLQRRFYSEQPGEVFSVPYAKFIISCSITFAIGAAACGAFCAICFSGGLLVLSLLNGAGAEPVFEALMIGSVAVALSVFAFVYWLSFKLPF